MNDVGKYISPFRDEAIYEWLGLAGAYPEPGIAFALRAWRQLPPSRPAADVGMRRSIPDLQISNHVPIPSADHAQAKLRIQVVHEKNFLALQWCVRQPPRQR